MNIVQVPVEQLKPHPRNYRKHPDDQLAHIIFSIKNYGFYRNVIATKDGTILAGHGVVQAANKMGLKEVPVIYLDLEQNDPRALKILIGDNEISKLGDIDDRVLTDMLKEIKEFDFSLPEFKIEGLDIDFGSLSGTGFDENMLAALVFNTRPDSEIKNMDAAREWVGMPTYQEESPENQKSEWDLVVHFETQKDRDLFALKLGIEISEKAKFIYWPEKKLDDTKAVKFQ